MRNLKVCPYCYEAITSRGIKCRKMIIYIDDDELDIVCDWCDEWSDILYDIEEA